VGVNKFAREGDVPIPLQRIHAAVERNQAQRVKAFRANRDGAQVEKRLSEVAQAAKDTENLLPSFIEAVDAGVTLGEIAGELRGVFGTHVARERIA